MIRKLYILAFASLTLCTTSCNDWLDVKPDTEQKEEDQFSTYQGFQDALIGCYMSLGNQDIYGERLTMTNIESLANLWYIEENTNRYEDKDLAAHTYTTTYAESAIKAIYSNLFNVIAQANVIIKNADERGDVITDPAIRATIQGEAYAIRAYLQLDVLRLFGQVPQGSQQVSLPYSETTSIYEMPAYYDFNSYVEKLKNDIEKAKSLLKDNDPVFKYTFSELNSGPSNLDDFMYYRQSRMNYWAVKALEARMYLYIGQKELAYQTAREVIDATLNGQPVITMSGEADFKAGYKLCPSECLFYLSKYDVKDYSSSILVGGNTSTQISASNLYITLTMRDQLYAGINTSNYNRYSNWWNTQSADNFGTKQATITKYYWNDDDVQNPGLYYQIIPMIRMSEIYLIAMECTTDLNEANEFYKAYMLEHNSYDASTNFTSLNDIQDFIINEYRREFYVEGQMFYTYKRFNSNSMLWRNAPVNESEYILPLPTSEYNPNK